MIPIDKSSQNVSNRKILITICSTGFWWGTKVTYNLHQLHQESIWNHPFPGMQLIQPETNWMRMRMRISVH